MHFHVLIRKTPESKPREGALCLTIEAAEREALIESTTPAGNPNGRLVETKPCDLPCFGSAAIR